MSANNFRIAKGDLVVTDRTYSRVEGVSKLTQDLVLWLLERIGTDPATPTYGSTLDGGVIDGKPVQSYIGVPGSVARMREIAAEVRRVLELYQETQIQKMQLEMALFQGKHTLAGDEVLETIDSINATISGDLIVVKVELTTASGKSLQLLVPVEA